MTGEISLRGRVLRVGGVKEKVLAAVRFGVKHVILPEPNKPDWLEVPAEVRAKIKVHFVNHISQVIRVTLDKIKHAKMQNLKTGPIGPGCISQFCFLVLPRWPARSPPTISPPPSGKGANSPSNFANCVPRPISPTPASWSFASRSSHARKSPSPPASWSRKPTGRRFMKSIAGHQTSPSTFSVEHRPETPSRYSLNGTIAARRNDQTMTPFAGLGFLAGGSGPGILPLAGAASDEAGNAARQILPGVGEPAPGFRGPTVTPGWFRGFTRKAAPSCRPTPTMPGASC